MITLRAFAKFFAHLQDVARAGRSNGIVDVADEWLPLASHIHATPAVDAATEAYRSRCALRAFDKRDEDSVWRLRQFAAARLIEAIQLASVTDPEPLVEAAEQAVAEKTTP